MRAWSIGVGIGQDFRLLAWTTSSAFLFGLECRRLQTVVGESILKIEFIGSKRDRDIHGWTRCELPLARRFPKSV